MTCSRGNKRQSAFAWLTILCLPLGSFLVAPAEAATNPSPRRGNAMAVDPATGNVVMFGGATSNGPSDETWLWNGTSWSRPSPAARPPARYNASMAEDPTTGTIVLFGGETNSQLFADTWTWDGRTKTWTQQPVSNAHSARTTRRAMAYDGANGKVVLFDDFGIRSLARFPRTWTWDGRSKTWTLEDPPTQPEWRDWASMAYDAVSGKVVLFGGDNTELGGSLYNDTWTWDGGSKTWTKETTAATPRPRGRPYIAYHAASSKVILFGGLPEEDVPGLNDTWTWNGAKRTWTKQQPSKRPCPRYWGAMAYHPATGSTVLFGGRGTSGPDCTSLVLSDTWGWNGANWKRRA